MPPKKDEKKAEPALPPEPKDDMPLLLDCLKGTKDKVSRLQSALWLAQMAMASEEVSAAGYGVTPVSVSCELWRER